MTMLYRHGRRVFVLNLVYGCIQQWISLTEHRDWKQGETASVTLSRDNKIYLQYQHPLSSLINMLYNLLIQSVQSPSCKK